ncbi:Rapamycin-insensitive companion of mTOR [Gryllus bimaculatus]|nr:Rapamycin-insensitive companion of mTOR [Gryllus bimaculatus]
MAMASWMIRGRNSRTGRTLRNRHDSEDDVQLDLTKDCSENAKQILTNICKKQGLTEGKRFGYLNAFVKLLTKTKETGELGYTVEQLFSLQVALAHDASQVRSAALRVVRYLLKKESHVKTLNDLHYPYLIARSFDLHLHNDAERMQALRVIRRMLLLAPTIFSPSLVCSLIALANGAAEEKDKMLRVCLATLSEICVMNTEVFIACGGVTALQRNLLECSMPRIAESLCGVLLFLLNNPVTREKAGVRLQALAAPFCDFHWDPSRNRDEREVRFHCSRLALLSVLRSWPGVLHFCHPGDSSGLRAIVNILYVRQLEVRKAVLDLLYELLGLPQPEWTDEFSVALEAVDPSHPRDAWRLSEGFVAAEGRSILPHLAKCRPNLVQMHLALLLYTFLEVGLLEAIAEVIVTADTFISVRATILLGELLHLVHVLLPPECCNLTPPLPTLLAKAANPDDPAAQNQALAAIAALARLQTILKKQPAPASLFLDQLLQRGAWGVRSRSGGLPPIVITEELGLSFSSSTRSKREKNKLYQLMLKDSDDILRDSMVLSNKDGFSWNWNVVRAILKSRSEALRRLEDSSYKTFLRRLVQYYKPSSNRFSRVELSSKRQMNIYTLTGFELLDCLLDAEEGEGQKMLSEFLADLWLQVDAITSSRSAHDCLFSPQHVANSLCQDYFLFIGRLCRTPRGLRVLEKAGILQQLLNLVVATNHECYVKLVIAGLDYSLDAMPRIILGKVLTAGVEVSRLYATQHMLVLLRAQLPDFHKWGIELLVMQLYDSSRRVSSVALNVLSEAVEDKACLESLISLRPSLLHLGDKGLLLLISFLSTTTGFSFLQDAGFVATQLERWATNFNYRYVRIVEGELHDSLTLHQRGEDGRYSQRITSARHYVKDVLVPPHLYGQLAQHSAGIAALKQDPYLPKFFQIVHDGICDKESEVLQLKTALWAVGHIGTSDAGVALLEQADVLQHVVHLAEECAEFAARATAFYALGLIATTSAGADSLSQLGWLSVRHDRHEQWPVIAGNPEPEHLPAKPDFEVDDSVSLSSGVGGAAVIESWDLEPGGETSDGRIFYMPGDEESGNEDEGMLLDESSLTAQWTPDMGSSSGGKSGVEIAHQPSQSHRKSATLPHWRPGVPTPRHTRSLSESKQLPPQIIVGGDSPMVGDWGPQVVRGRGREPFTGGCSTVGNTLVPKPEEMKSRSNSCTDSSGVSSCDSGAGRHAPSERLPPTLSPIPSSASLHTLQTNTMIRRASQISQRKLSASTHGSVTSEGTHSSPSDTIVGASSMSRLSQQDLLGYATLRSLHRHRRPLLSDSSSSKGDTMLAFDDSFPLSLSITGIGASSPASSRGLKVQSLDRHFSHPALGELEGRVNPLLQEGSNSLPLEVGTKTRNEPGHPCYLGICLPRDIMVIYRCDNSSRPAASNRRRGSTSFSELEQLPEVGHEIEPSSSSDSEDYDIIPSQQTLGSRKDNRLHAASLCMVCSRFHSSRKISVGSSRHRTDTESSQGGLESPILCPPRRHKSQSFSSGGAETLAWNTPTESLASSNSPRQIADEARHATSQKLLRREILKHVNRMSNPVWAKLSKQALIQLKQKNPSVFQDVCLYSAVSQRLASCSYRYVARRFIQELFLDLNVDVLYEESNNILQNQQQKSSANSEGSFVTAASKVTTDLVAGNHDSLSNISSTLPSSTISALSIKLASLTPSSDNIPAENISKETPIAVSPPKELVPNGSEEYNSSGVGKPSGSDPVPIAAPAKQLAISTGYMMRSPPLEVVKEEPAVSVSSSEQQSPLDTSSIMSNGQVDEENVAFLNQKFDDIPMIDEMHTNTEVTKRKQALDSEKEVIVPKVVRCTEAPFQDTTNTPCFSDSSEVRTMLVNQDSSNLRGNVPSVKEGTALVPSFQRGDVLINAITEHTSYVPADLLVKSSAIGSSGKTYEPTKSNHAGHVTSSGGGSNTKGMTDSIQTNITSTSIRKCPISQTPHMSAVSKASTSGCKEQSKTISTHISASVRQRKVATTSAPDMTSLQTTGSVAFSRSSNVPNLDQKVSKDKR